MPSALVAIVLEIERVDCFGMKPTNTKRKDNDKR
ncbi:hypothetical protein SuNHUV7_27170 (plasmid) [Pseudoseohaeicola sp. NH-UV-7]